MSVAKSLDRMPESFVSDKSVTRAVSRAVKVGKLRELASRLYSRNMVDPPEAIVARNLWSIIAGHFPSALIADRTMLSSNDRRAASGQPCRNFASRSPRRRWIARVSQRPQAVSRRADRSRS